jgi:cell shape-determining protein MreC
MTYLRRSNAAEKRSRKTTFLIVLALVCLFAVHFFFPKAYATILYPITSVFWKTETGAVGWFVRMGKMVSSKYSLIAENKRLADEIAARDSSMLLLDALRQENEDLKNAFDRTGSGDDVLGVILSRPPMSPYDSLVIDVGAHDGIEVGDRVYTDGDTVIGDIAEVYGSQSKVSLYSTPGRVLPVIIGSAKVETQATGRGAGNFIARLPVEIGIEEGDQIILPQIRPHAFGVVEKIIVDSADSLQTILFKVPVNIHEFRYVQVDRGGKR